MVVRIRLLRMGAKKKPFYRVVIANSYAPRDGRTIECVGYYNPMLPHDNNKRVVLKNDRVNYWISQGAQLTKRVAKLVNASTAS